MTPSSETTLKFFGTLFSSQLPPLRKSLSGAQGLALPAGSAFHKKAPQTSAGVSLGKQSLAGRQREQGTLQGREPWVSRFGDVVPSWVLPA